MQGELKQFFSAWPQDSLELVGHLLTLSDRLREAMAKPDVADDLRGNASVFADYLDKRARDMLTDAGITPERVSALFARPGPAVSRKGAQA